MDRIISNIFLEEILSQASTDTQQYQDIFSLSYQRYHNHRRQWIDKLNTFDKQIFNLYNCTITDAFTDYETPIEDYCVVHGILAAAGCLSGQAITLADLKSVPGLKDKEQKLKEACDYFIEQLPEEERAECISFFEERKQAIRQSGDYYFLYGFELMFSLLNKAGFDLSVELLEKVHQMIQL